MVLVFKTSIATEAMLDKVSPHINQLLPDAVWNIDIEDCDHVLRVVHTTDISTNIIKALAALGISCELL